MRRAIFEANYAMIPLGMNAYNGFALIDKEDVWLEEYNWNIAGAMGYPAKRKSGGGFVMMHNVLMIKTTGSFIDHINGDVRDNRRANLRVCTPSQNSQNRRLVSKTGYKGVNRVRDKYTARIAGQYLGFFNTPLEASKAYDEKAKEIFGEFAKTNS